MPEVEVPSIPGPLDGLDHKSEPVVEIKSTSSEDGSTTGLANPSPVPTDHSATFRKGSVTVSSASPPPTESKSSNIEHEGSTEENKLKDDDESEEEESANKKSEKAAPTMEQKYGRLLERFEKLEKKLKDSGYIVVDESEILPGENGTTEVDKEDEEEKPEKPFKLEEQIKYVPSEEWWNGKVKALWTNSESPHTLVISMKPATVNAHSLLDADAAEAVKEKTVKGDKELDDLLENLNPDRITVMCPTLLAEIGRISGAKFQPNVNVIVAPFKPLIPFRDQFKESMEEKQTLYEKLLQEKEAAEKKAAEKKAAEVDEKPDHEAENDKADPKLERKTTDKVKKKGKNKDEDKQDEADTKDKSKEAEESWSAEDQTRLKDAQKIAHGMKCILYIFDKHLTVTMEIRRQIQAGTLKEIAFDYLWHLFKPGDFIACRKPRDQAYRVLHVGGGRRFRDPGLDYEGKPAITSMPKSASHFFIDCYNIDYDGKSYGPAPMTFKIAPYEGLRAITALDYVPTKLMPEADRATFENTMLARGKKFVRLVRMSHVRYRGLSLKEGNFRHEELDGDAIIDFALAFKNSKEPNIIEHPVFGGDVIEEPTKADDREWKEALQGCSSYGHCETLYSYDDSEFDAAQRTAFINLLSTNLDTVAADEGKLGKDRHMLLPYRVYGYLLLSRKWYPLDIDLVQDVKEKNKDAPDGFADLVLEEDHKQIVRALVKTHARGPRSTPTKKDDSLPARDIDIVKGKGKGLIILLHGVPGVGKTSTAECVAANTNRPLFPITCGDIGGTTAKEVEDNLESYFDLAREWGCVLLLDEADVFLGERTKGDFVQNSLVSVFLRVLEYYSGILILTTNRVGQFDEAIKSRVHISLYYPPLTKKSSLEIWKMNLNRLTRQDEERPNGRPIIFSKKDIIEFAKGHWNDNEATKTNWNGRQIKNAFQTAIALAEWDYMESKGRLRSDSSGPLLEARHFKQVAVASARFDNYLQSVRDADSKRAEQKQNRKDTHIDKGTPTETGRKYPSHQEKSGRPKKTSIPTGSASDGTEDSDSPSEDSDDDFKAKKQEMDTLRLEKEKKAEKKAEAERAEKKKVKEKKRQAVREKEEERRRQELMARGGGSSHNESEEEEDDDY